LKQQIVHRRVHETIADVREALRAGIARYNAEWLAEKKGDLGPAALRRQHEPATMSVAAQPGQVSKKPGAIQPEVPGRPGNRLAPASPTGYEAR
jgi:hypothetical protein